METSYRWVRSCGRTNGKRRRVKWSDDDSKTTKTTLIEDETTNRYSIKSVKIHRWIPEANLVTVNTTKRQWGPMRWPVWESTFSIDEFVGQNATVLTGIGVMLDSTRLIRQSKISVRIYWKTFTRPIRTSYRRQRFNPAQSARGNDNMGSDGTTRQSI